MHLWYSSSQKRDWSMDIPLFSEPPYFMNDVLPDAFISKRVLSETMTFLFAMDKAEAIGAKARSPISHFLQKMYNIDTDF